MKTVFIVASKFWTDIEGYTDIEKLVLRVCDNQESAERRVLEYNKDFFARWGRMPDKRYAEDAEIYEYAVKSREEVTDD